MAEDSASLDPARAYETTPGIVNRVAYQTLVTFPDNSVETIIPMLAEKWEISSDGKTYTFTLNANARFSDGSPVTAEDVVFSLNRTKNIKGNPSFLAANFASVEAENATTVVLTLTEPDAATLSKLIFPAFSIVNKKLVTANGGTDAADADTTDKAEQWLNANSAGSGPYKLEKWERGVETVLVANPGFWGKAPAIERVIIRNLPEAAAQKTALEAGDIDLALGLGADQIGGLQTNPNISLFEGLRETVVFLIFNNDPAIGGQLADAKVQRAIRLALDYEGMQALGGGKTVIPPSMMPLGFPGAWPAEKAPTRNVEEAKKLLAEANASSLTVDLDYPDTTLVGINFGTFAQKVQADLAEVGITVNLKPAALQPALEKYRSGQQPFGLWLWNPDFIDATDRLAFLPEGKVGGTRANWKNSNSSADIQQLRDEAKAVTTDEQRNAVWDKIQAYMETNSPYAALVQPSLQIAHSSALKGYVYHPAWEVDVSLISK